MMLSILTALLLLSCSARADIIIDGFTDATNDRFTNSASFIGAGLDFSGVGRRQGWSTLISRNVVLTAEHSRGNGLVRFYPSNDPSATPVVRTILDGGQQVGSTDLYLRVLDSPVASGIKVYDFATEQLSAPAYDPDTNAFIYGAGSFQNEIAYMVGVSPTPNADPGTDQAVGRNRISGYLENIDFGANSDNDSLVLIRESSGNSNYVQYESRFVGGDSGAPLFIEENGELLLLGVNSFISTGGTELSGVTYIGNHVDEINAFIMANAVPEPGVLGIGILFLLAGAGIRRRPAKSPPATLRRSQSRRPG